MSDHAPPRYFFGPKALESNFLQYAFAHNGITLPTSEHHLMREKAILMGDHESRRKIEKAKTPRSAKAFGKKVKPWNQARWDLNCDQIMEDILVSKFSSSQRMKDYILGIHGHFYEASPWDRIWGIGISVANAERGDLHRGQNKLGNALDRARARIVAQVEDQ